MSGAYERIAEGIYDVLIGDSNIGARLPEYEEQARTMDQILRHHVKSTIKKVLVKELGPEERKESCKTNLPA